MDSSQAIEEAEQEQERKHFCRIVNAFKSYKILMMRRIVDKEKYVKTFPTTHQSLLDGYMRHLEKQKLCIQHNSDIIDLIIEDVQSMFENVQHNNVDDPGISEVLSSDLEKVQSTLKQIVRDWSEEGAKERELCYAPIIDRIENLYPPEKVCAKNINILVPGAGLGRLSYELAKRGFTCQGNEFSLFMLFVSNFVLNRLRGVNSLHVFPWAHSGSNTWKNNDQLRKIEFPDCEPSGMSDDSNFSMAAGDFLEIYNDEETWDTVATCFFVDCANNIVAFIETIYKILKPGGYWINLGPLLYHFADISGENSIEPTYEIVRQIISGMGFKFLEEKCNVESTYTQNDHSMLNSKYSSVFFVVQKP